MNLRRYMICGEGFSCWLVEKSFWGAVKFTVIWKDARDITHVREMGTADEVQAFIELKETEGRTGV